MPPVSSAIYGCAGLELSVWESEFFAETNPLGLILFARNVETPDQVRALTEAFRTIVDRSDAPVLIDQEGGRVQRLKPPTWRQAPPPRIFGRLAERDPQAAVAAVELNARLLAQELLSLGITVDCAPLLDLSMKDTHKVIGDRAFSGDTARVATLGRAACQGFLAGGVVPVIKHIPGHGRANVDSHFELPQVDATRRELEATDFAPFRALADAPWAMTAHVIYSAIDPDRAATVSPTVIAEVIRGDIGFEGLLVSDDLSMQALSGDLSERTAAALTAGCDIALHCNGDPSEMRQVAEAATPLSDAARRRLTRGEAQRRAPSLFDSLEAAEALEHLLSTVALR
ncbi:beta-N-acetylhexosaminidase [Algihabitans albus]|uniref:beta-N-acetylhexosaminidase n=1 Tax=Algihabitans albus TaxID=2164067 RepID=UPI000E5C9852|nr:beta-N-acetylhexosaminidase [Algihabitans albus]